MIKKILFTTAASLILSVPFMPADSSALSTSGTPIIAIDGNSDLNVTVDILSIGGTSSYSYGYFLNGSTTFNVINLASPTVTFNGGDVIDFALQDTSTGTFYTLSGDLLDNSYSVLMTFANEVPQGGGLAAQVPAGWNKPYYFNANITWSLPSVVNTNELALNFINNGNDGIAPVPEPSTLILLGSGLAGCSFLLRRRK